MVPIIEEMEVIEGIFFLSIKFHVLYVYTVYNFYILSLIVLSDLVTYSWYSNGRKDLREV